jgi:uncharacterized RDD family membrane protein YckC
MSAAAVHIETPEGISFALPLASTSARSLAWAIDVCAITALASSAGKLTEALGAVNPDAAAAAYVIAYFICSMGYSMVLEWHWRGQTIGKRLMGLRVVDAEGLRLQFSQVVMRNLLRFVDILPLFYLVGGVATVFSSHRQRLGDLAANTVVIRHVPVSHPDATEALGSAYNSLLSYPHLAARLRSRVGPEEALAALRALRLRDGFDPAARLELFAQMAAHFQSLVRFPDEAVEGLTDEQYVRNVMQIVYGGARG